MLAGGNGFKHLEKLSRIGQQMFAEFIFPDRIAPSSREVLGRLEKAEDEVGMKIFG